jgi:hypothetical protein
MPPPSLPMIMNDFLNEKSDRKSLSRTPSFSFIQAILDMSEKVMVSEVEVKQEEEEVIKEAVELPAPTEQTQKFKNETSHKFFILQL